MNSTVPAPVAVICGGSAGVGRAAAKELARARYRLALIARSQRGLEDARQELEQLGAEVLVLTADVAAVQEVDAAAARVERELGPIEVWVNAAMVTVFGPAATLEPAEVRRVTEVTYLGSVHGTLAALRYMRERNRGTIVQVGSALSYRAIPLQSAYCGAKFAVRGFTDALRSELHHDRSRVRLTMVQLPAHNTPQFEWARNKTGQRAQPVPPIYAPAVAGRAIARAVIDAPRELWLGRATLQAIVGTMLAPGLLDRMMAKQAYEGQLTGETLPERADNLFEPVDGCHRTEGRFGDVARPRALGLSGETVRLLLALLAGTAAAAALVVVSIAG